jgi:curved DNA-binding protein CbpA
MAEYTDPQFWPQLQQLAQTIDGLDYFQILNLPTTASGPQIKSSYYGLARALHPDKFFHLDDVDTKASVHKIYKRITEAYMVLKDEPKRLKYIHDISGPDRERKLRFTEESEAEQKEQAKAAHKVAKTPKGEQMYNTAMVDLANGRFDAAYKALQSATLFEPQNAELKRLLLDVDKKRKSG